MNSNGKYNLCQNHKELLGVEACTEGFHGCEFENAREGEVKKMENENNKAVCPVCGFVITDFENEVSEPCEHVMATYVDICGEEFTHVHDDFRSEAEKMEIRANDWDHPDGEVCLLDLMQGFVESHDGYEIIELTTHGMACGPASTSEYNLIKISS